MGRELVAVTLVGLFLIGLVGIGLGASTGDGVPQVEMDDNSTTTVSVSGQGTVSAEPDQATVSIAVTATADQSSTATERLANETARLRNELSGAESVASVTTTSFRLFERRDFDRPDFDRPPGQRGPNVTRTFVAEQSFDVVVNDTDAVGRVVDTAVAAGATSVDSVRFTLSEERQADLRETALDRAVEDASREANAVAGSAGLALGEIKSLSVGGDFGPVFQTQEARDGTVIDGGPVTVSASVQITYAAVAGAPVEVTPTAEPVTETAMLETETAATETSSETTATATPDEPTPTAQPAGGAS